MNRWAYIENIAIHSAIGVGVPLLFYLGAGGHSFWMLLLLLFVNSGKAK